MDKENTGCWAWIVSFKQSCNERWARFRNRLRRRFYARRGQSIDPATIVNETGTKDMVVTKSRKNKVLPEGLATPSADEKDVPADDGGISATGIDGDFEKLVTEYVNSIIAKAADDLQMERQASLGNKNATVENSADDVSLSQSIISQIAHKEVTESLSQIVSGSNLNQSAIHKDIKEFMVQKSLELLAEKLTTADLLSGYNC